MALVVEQQQRRVLWALVSAPVIALALFVQLAACGDASTVQTTPTPTVGAIFTDPPELINIEGAWDYIGGQVEFRYLETDGLGKDIYQYEVYDRTGILTGEGMAVVGEGFLLITGCGADLMSQDACYEGSLFLTQFLATGMLVDTSTEESEEIELSRQRRGSG